jgi:hypothetical protein
MENRERGSVKNRGESQQKHLNEICKALKRAKKEKRQNQRKAA